MTFAWPHLLWALLIPAALLAWELTHRRRMTIATRPKILRAEAGARSLKLSTFQTQTATTSVRPRVWLCIGLALALVALARPQWGRLEEPVFDQSREILLAMDLSRSMLTEDVKPSRLERAKLLVHSLLEKLAGERVGLVVFSGTAFLQSPLSADYEILREFLPTLGPNFLPEGGSNYGALLDTALQAFGATTTADRFLIILSDGEATDENWRTRADEKGEASRIEELKKKGVRVIGLGVGTVGGAMIPDGSGGLVKDERGAVVMSKLESATLQELARATNGVYRDASSWVDLARLVQETIESGRKGEFVEKHTVRMVERFQWPLAIALWCLLISFCYEFPVRPRVRDITVTTPSPSIGEKQPSAVQEQVKAAAPAVLLFIATCALLRSTPVEGAETSPAEPPPLARIVGRLATADHRTARDWAELGRETVNWGARMKSEQHPVPEGPVRDALAAVDLGAKIDSKATDWPKLREELEALLEKPEDQQQQQQQQQNQQKQQDQKDQQQQSQDQQKDQKSDAQKKQGNQNEDRNQKTDSSNQQPPEKPDEQKKPGESAFGDMNKKQEEPPPPPPSQNTQKVGGAPEKKEETKVPVDPTLAVPMQKLEQLRDQDSPAQLFQLMEGEKKPTKKTGKDW